jgi:hypothetical protein
VPTLPRCRPFRRRLVLPRPPVSGAADQGQGRRHVDARSDLTAPVDLVAELDTAVTATTSTPR